MIFDCNFNTKSWSIVGEVYQCKVKLQESKSLYILEGVKGEHDKGMSNSNVEALKVDKQDINKIPSEIYAFFANIKALQWQKSKMLTITAKDLKQFPNLVYLDVNSNSFLTLASNLFSGTRKLVYINFNDNNLEQVGIDLLFGLNDLSEVRFQNNPCIDRFETTQGRMSILNQLLPIECPEKADTKTTTERTEPKTTDPSSPPKIGCSQGCMEQIGMLASTVEDLEKRNVQLERSVVDLANELIASNAEHDARISELERQMRELGSSPCAPCQRSEDQINKISRLDRKSHNIF